MPLRHKAFSDMESVRRFLCERPQHSCFYSTAYWKKPHELKMDDKQWLGADLIFDLDGDANMILCNFLILIPVENTPIEATMIAFCSFSVIALIFSRVSTSVSPLT